MQTPVISPNILIILTIVVATVYGAAAGKNHLRSLILSVYVGIVLAQQFTGILEPYVGQLLSRTTLTLLLFSVPIVIFGCVPPGGHGHGDKGSSIANMVVGALTGGLIVASALILLPTSELAAVNDDSFIAIILSQYQLWLLGCLPVIAIILGMLKSKEHLSKHKGRK